MDDATVSATTTSAPTSAPTPTSAPAPAAAPSTPAPSAPALPAVGDEIDGLGVVFGVRMIRDDGTYVQIGSGDAKWIKV